VKNRLIPASDKIGIRLPRYWPALLCIAPLLASCNKQQAEAPAPRPKIAVTHPIQRPAVHYLYTTGTTQAVKAVDLVARVAGTLQSIDYKDGNEVKAGQRLFLIERDQYQASVEQANANVQQSTANLSNAQSQLDRQNQLSTSQVTAQTNVDNARATRDSAAAQLHASQAALTMAKLNLGYTSVTAPFDGIVTAHQADVGALVGTNGPTTLATIVQLSPIWANITVPDNDLLTIRKRLREHNISVKDLSSVPVDVGTQIDQDFPFKGKLDYVAPETSSDTGTLSVRAIFDNQDRSLLPGLFVRVRIPLETVTDALLVPSSAIGTDQQGRYVLIASEAGMIERRDVTLLDAVGDLQQVKGKLATTDWVVTNVMSGAMPGTIVEVQKGDLPAEKATGTTHSQSDASSN